MRSTDISEGHVHTSLASRRPRTVAVLADPAAWLVAAGCLAAGFAGTGLVGLWLYQTAQHDTLELFDRSTWVLAGFVLSVVWRWALLATLSTGALWARARGAGDAITAGRLAGRVLERGWLLTKVAFGWAVAVSLLTRLGRRFRRLRWLTRLGRLSAGGSAVAAIVSVARREPPARAGDAKRAGRNAVGGRTAALVGLLVGGVTALPLTAALTAAATRTTGTVQLVVLAAVLPAFFCVTGLVAGARLWNAAAKRGERRARRR